MGQQYGQSNDILGQQRSMPSPRALTIPVAKSSKFWCAICREPRAVRHYITDKKIIVLECEHERKQAV
jgi:hypothetical protein